MGDPACWLANVCPGCGAFVEDPEETPICPRCGADMMEGEAGEPPAGGAGIQAQVPGPDP